MFILKLNDMRSSNIENLTFIVRAETREELEQFLERETVEYYPDDGWGRQYRKGGPLEWCNPLSSCDNNIVNVGNADEWAANARRQFEEEVMSLPVVT